MSTDGRIRVAADLDAVTAVADEDHSDIDSAAVERIWQAARHWYRAGMHPAIQLCLRHNGKVVLNRAIGHGWGNGPDDPPDAEKVTITTETPFCVYSAAKAVTTTVVHMLVDRGVFSLDDRVCDYLPSYAATARTSTTIRHVMTHSAGVPFAPGRGRISSGWTTAKYARAREIEPIYRPGLVHIYHALTWGRWSARSFRRHRQEHSRRSRRRDPRPARLPVDQLRRCGSRPAAGGTEPPDG
jgi:CubicO group peptidase (beta-lactamase class C family)